MNWRDLVYFSYKYYFKSPLLPDSPSVDHHFQGGSVPAVELIDPVSVSIGGDLMPYELIKPEFVTELWDEVGDVFFGSDLVFANLETPIDLSRPPSYVPEVMLNHMLFNTDEQTFRIFSGNGKFKGYDVLSVANNHSLDMGIDGLDASMDFLSSEGVLPVGARRTRETNSSGIVDVKGIRLGFVAFTYSLNEFVNPSVNEANGIDNKVNLLPLNVPDAQIGRIIEQVDACRKDGAQFIILSLHCGNAYQIYPSEVTVNLFSRVFRETGVDVIAGGHPHNLQPWRFYDFVDPVSGKMKRGFAIYSLADFIAYDIYTWCHLCAMLKLEIGKDASGEISFNARVQPMVMIRENGHLKLRLASNFFSEPDESSEKKDLRVLYETCMNVSSQTS